MRFLSLSYRCSGKCTFVYRSRCSAYLRIVGRNRTNTKLMMKPSLVLILLLHAKTLIAAESSINFESLPAFSVAGQLQMVVEIPAGTSIKNEYNSTLNSFPADVIEGKDRVIDFLPYPGNYGFIPSTKMDRLIGGDGDALDVLLLSQHKATGSILSIIPIAIVHLVDDGELDSKIIAVPYVQDQRIISATSYAELEESYPNIKFIIELWFTSYKGKDVVELINWEDDASVKEFINKWMIKSPS